MKYPVSAPLIGTWLYRRSVKELNNRALQGDEVAVQELAGIFCTHQDEAVRDIARSALCSLVTQPAKDMLCKEALERDNAELHRIATNSNYLPSDHGTQALFLFVTGKRERYAHIDPETHRPLLAAGYAQATNRGRSNARSAAKKSGQLPVLAAALMGTDLNRNSSLWSDEEWEIVVTGLILEQQWEVLWHLAIHAPLHPAIAALSAIEAAGWEPSGDERAIIEEITRSLPVEWTCPVPDEVSALTPHSPESQPLRLAFSGDGALLAAGCADGTICLWNTRAGTLVFRLPSLQGTISGIAISLNNTRLLCAGTNGTLQCRDTQKGTLLWSVESGERTPVKFACSRNGIAVVPLSAGAVSYTHLTLPTKRIV